MVKVKPKWRAACYDVEAAKAGREGAARRALRASLLHEQGNALKAAAATEITAYRENARLMKYQTQARGNDATSSRQGEMACRRLWRQWRLFASLIIMHEIIMRPPKKAKPEAA